MLYIFGLDDAQYVDGKLFLADITTSLEVYVWDIEASPLGPYHTGYYRGDVNGFLSIDYPYVYIPGAEHGLITLRFDDPTSIDEPEDVKPSRTELLTAYPNPFNTTIKFSINQPVSDDGEIQIYDVMGRLIKTIEIKSTSEVEWNGNSNNNQPVSSGIYFARYSGDNISKSIKVVLLK